jgi:hypothetical protein
MAAAGGGGSSDAQTAILIALLSQKASGLGDAQARLQLLLQHDPPSPTGIKDAIVNIHAEIIKCLDAINGLANNKPIPFPTDEQIVALSDAVLALGNATAKGAATVALIKAADEAIATIPN